MIGKLYFQDSLEDLFMRYNALGRESLHGLKNSQIAVDATMYLRNINYFPFGDKNLRQKLDESNRDFRQYQIDYTVFFGNKYALTNEQSRNHQMELFKRQISYKIFFNRIEQNCQIRKNLKKKEILQNFKNYFKMTQFDSPLQSLMMNQIEHSMKDQFVRNDINFIQSPVLSENQMGYLYDDKKINYLMAGPYVYLLLQSQCQVIRYINFKKREIEFFDFEILCKNLNIEPHVLRRILQAICLYFCNDTQEYLKGYFVANLQEKNFIEKYKKLRQENLNLLERMIRKLRNVIDPELKCMKFCEQVCLEFKINKQQISQLYNLLFKCPVFDQKLKLKFFPHKKSLTKNYFPIEFQQSNILILYVLGILPQEIMCLLSKSYNNTLIVSNQYLNCQEFFHYFSKKFKILLEISLSKLLQNSNLGKFDINVYNIKYQDQKFPLKYKNIVCDFQFLWIKQKDKKFNFYQFMNELKNRNNFILKKIDQEKNTPINLVKLHLFSSLCMNLRYINYQHRSMNNTGQIFCQLNSQIDRMDKMVFLECLVSNLMETKSFFKTSCDIHTFNINSNKKNKDSNYEELLTLLLNFQYDVGQNRKKEINDLLQKDQIFHTTRLIYKKILNLDPKLIGSKIWDLITGEIRDNIDLIVYISKIAIIVGHDLQIPMMYDEKCEQFAQILNLIQRSINLFIQSDISNFFLKTKFQENLEDLKTIRKIMIIENNYTQSLGSLLKNQLVQFIIRNKIKQVNLKHASSKMYILKINELCKQYQIKQTNIFVSYLEKIKKFMENIKKIKNIKNQKFLSNQSNGIQIINNKSYHLFKEYLKYIKHQIITHNDF